jgi:hypothetical protein
MAVSEQTAQTSISMILRTPEVSEFHMVEKVAITVMGATSLRETHDEIRDCALTSVAVPRRSNYTKVMYVKSILEV